MRVVVDTNVLISALITPFGNAARILDLALSGELLVIFDDRIISEFRDVLLRPKFDFEKSDVEELLSFIEDEGIKVTAIPLNEKLIDEDDLPFIEAANTGMADALITGNKRHFKGKSVKKIKVMSPDEFLKFWKQTRNS
ncbi:MAG: putative toxin-antitoxin system toxin component, PIN family [Nitrospirae bacterium]|nr:putative toxin-antitoxin system toxin component, PIN family [Nitrospirota bacterium]